MLTVEELRKSPALVDAALKFVEECYSFDGNLHMSRLVASLQNDIMYLMTTSEDYGPSSFGSGYCLLEFLCKAAADIDEAAEKLLKED